jgi:hypothetical protein
MNTRLRFLVLAFLPIVLNPFEVRGACTSMDVLSYQSADWRYLQVTQGNLPGFEQGPEPAGFATGSGGFGNENACAGQLLANTFWNSNTDMLLRRRITLPSGTMQVKVYVAIDNDVQVWFNGTDVSGGMRASEGCAIADHFVFSVPDNIVVAGDNLLAIRARDRGSLSFVDVRISADLPVAGPPQIRDHPKSQTISYPQNVVFTVCAVGSLPLTYQWQFQSTNLPSATNATLTLAGVGTNNTGPYQAIVHNAFGETTSTVAVLTFVPPSNVAYWDGGGDGTSWSDARNWSNDTLPTATNEVIISTANVTVRHSSGNTTVKNIQCEGDLVLSGGSMAVTSGASQLNGALTVFSGASLAVRSGASLAAAGATSIDGGSLSVSSGGMLVCYRSQTCAATASPPGVAPPPGRRAGPAVSWICPGSPTSSVVTAGRWICRPSAAGG